MSRPAMIFAAGFGTRMGALTAETPKPMLHVGGKALVDHAIDLAAEAGAAPIVANVHYRADRIAPHLRARGVSVSHETDRLLDTGGGLRRARPLLGDGAAVFTLNADTVFVGANPLIALDRAWRDGMGVLLSVVPLSRARERRGGGDFSLGADGRLTQGGDWVYSGAEIIDPAVLDAEPGDAFSLAPVWFRLAREGRLFGAPYPGDWVDVGHPEGLAAANAMVAHV